MRKNDILPFGYRTRSCCVASVVAKLPAGLGQTYARIFGGRRELLPDTTAESEAHRLQDSEQTVAARWFRSRDGLYSHYGSRNDISGEDMRWQIADREVMEQAEMRHHIDGEVFQNRAAWFRTAILTRRS